MSMASRLQYIYEHSYQLFLFVCAYRRGTSFSEEKTLIVYTEEITRLWFPDSKEERYKQLNYRR